VSVKEATLEELLTVKASLEKTWDKLLAAWVAEEGLIPGTTREPLKKLYGMFVKWAADQQAPWVGRQPTARLDADLSRLFKRGTAKGKPYFFVGRKGSKNRRKVDGKVW